MSVLSSKTSKRIVPFSSQSTRDKMTLTIYEKTVVKDITPLRSEQDTDDSQEYILPEKQTEVSVYKDAIFKLNYIDDVSLSENFILLSRVVNMLEKDEIDTVKMSFNNELQVPARRDSFDKKSKENVKLVSKKFKEIIPQSVTGVEVKRTTLTGLTPKQVKWMGMDAPSTYTITLDCHRNSFEQVYRANMKNLVHSGSVYVAKHSAPDKDGFITIQNFNNTFSSKYFTILKNISRFGTRWANNTGRSVNYKNNSM